MRNDKTYEKVRENIERLVMKEKIYRWNGEATKEFIDVIFLMGNFPKPKCPDNFTEKVMEKINKKGKV